MGALLEMSALWVRLVLRRERLWCRLCSLHWPFVFTTVSLYLPRSPGLGLRKRPLYRCGHRGPAGEGLALSHSLTGAGAGAKANSGGAGELAQIPILALTCWREEDH